MVKKNFLVYSHIAGRCLCPPTEPLGIHMYILLSLGSVVTIADPTNVTRYVMHKEWPRAGVNDLDLGASW